MRNDRKPVSRILRVGAIVFLCLFFVCGVAQAKNPIIIFFADNHWDSILIHNPLHISSVGAWDIKPIL